MVQNGGGGTRLHDPAPWLPLAEEASSRNLGLRFFTTSVQSSVKAFLPGFRPGWLKYCAIVYLWVEKRTVVRFILRTLQECFYTTLKIIDQDRTERVVIVLYSQISHTFQISFTSPRSSFPRQQQCWPKREQTGPAECAQRSAQLWRAPQDGTRMRLCADTRSGFSTKSDKGRTKALTRNLSKMKGNSVIQSSFKVSSRMEQPSC